jgi:GNAT superfamily N-acetyltransferase
MATYWSSNALILAQRNETIIGSVHVTQHTPSTACFGMLVTNADYRGLGIGKALLDATEDRGRTMGCTLMRLELLKPRLFVHPVKSYLAQWYSRIGYEYVEDAAFETKYPHLAIRLATPCDFTVYTKPL